MAHSNGNHNGNHKGMRAKVKGVVKAHMSAEKEELRELKKINTKLERLIKKKD